VSFAAITLCVASQRVFVVVVVVVIVGVVDLVINSVRKLLDTPSYVSSSSSVLLRKIVSTTSHPSYPETSECFHFNLLV
jgi:hypothetical protein